MSDMSSPLFRLYSPTAPVFLADIDPSRRVLRLHVRRGVDVRTIREHARTLLETQDRRLAVTVQQHRRKDLTLPRSLEHWLSRLATGEVVYDPTLVVARARYLIDVARRVRLALGRRVKGVFFDYARNQLVVVVRPVGDRAETTTIVQRAVAEASRDVEASALGTSQVGASLKIVSERPAHELVPVDGLSVTVLGGLRRLARSALASVAMAIAGLAAIGPAAASTGLRSDPPLADTAQLGVLLGLSLLSNTSSQSGADAFAAAALEMYFGRSAGAEKAMQLAQAQQTTTETPNQDPNQTTTESSPGS